jgi:hypothetical protein
LLPLAACATGTGGDSDSPTGGSGDVVINEFMASNTSTFEDPHVPGTFPDWVELFSADGFDLSGATLTDDLTTPDKWSFPDGTSIAAGGYLVVFCDGDVTESGANPHTSFKLGSGGEDLGIYDAAGDPMDQLTYDAQANDISMARMPDGTGDFAPDESPTPGAMNE